jgi:hypothetical protein
MSEGKPEDELRGYAYEPSDDPLQWFHSRTPDERLHWRDEARAFSISLVPRMRATGVRSCAAAPELVPGSRLGPGRSDRSCCPIARASGMVAWVPECPKRTFSRDGSALQLTSAMRTSPLVAAPKLVPRANAADTASRSSGYA